MATPLFRGQSANTTPTRIRYVPAGRNYDEFFKNFVNAEANPSSAPVFLDQPSTAVNVREQSLSTTSEDRRAPAEMSSAPRSSHMATPVFRGESSTTVNLRDQSRSPT
ncbi:hypothetical protein M409DRAFT_28521 [Zasmidium cellare ATCC 36951]|uniref:Uncharacterized protein n=1 Tax=Zasmidium cellare ATCC 36951 TaxID=1080233 RepID=A0A6A6C5P3_ZASCE|nr:uncharacterized protein M409DRAFT_28521 [Zasmidium cellare ATCC 36951]KAF2161192.1 hypothetical protein M409DRAFT_28521 [Zasmidium cellare ATCC 36951]